MSKTLRSQRNRTKSEGTELATINCRAPPTDTKSHTTTDSERTLNLHTTDPATQRSNWHGNIFAKKIFLPGRFCSGNFAREISIGEILPDKM